MTELENALESLNSEAELLPFKEGTELLHGIFERLVTAGFLLPKEPWLNTFELTAIAKLVYLNGRNRLTDPYPNLSRVLNAYKKYWRAIEKKTAYSDDPEVIASFVLRFAYQQLPLLMTPQRMEQNYLRTFEIFSGQSATASEIRTQFKNEVGIPYADFIEVAKAIFAIFKRRSNIPDHALHDSLRQYFAVEPISKTLGVLSATRGQLSNYYNSTALPSAAQSPYEFNPLLRFPLLYRRDRYWCAYPELINYAATRGIYFYLADALGHAFCQAFSEAFEEYVSLLWSRVMGPVRVLTERMERGLGLQSKANDLTIIFKNAAVLFECKNSGLFSLSKKSAAPQDLVRDVKKNLANAEKRKGLFQLYDKVQSIRCGRLPSNLRELYSTVETLYPVILLYDEIWFANRPETLRNIIDKELRENGIVGFDYQIWHIEELEFLLREVPSAQVPSIIAEKFEDPECRNLDLSSYLSRRPGLEHLRVALFTPGGDSQSWRILRRLADATPK